MEKSPIVLLCGDETFLRGPYRDEVELKSKKVLSASSLSEVNPDDEVDIVFTDLSIPGDTSEIFRCIKEGLGARILVLAPQRSKKIINFSNEISSNVLYCSDVDEVSDVLSEASQRAHAYLKSHTTLKTQFSFAAKDFSEKFQKLEILSALEDLEILSHSDKNRIQMVFQEAIINAVEHGCLELSSSWKDEMYPDGSDRFSLEKLNRMADIKYGSRKVYVTAEFKDSSLSIEVQDEGNGFATDHMIKPALDSLHGRGLGLMTSLMDEVMFFDQGKKIQMKKVLHGA